MPAGAAYPDGRLTTGDPVFLRLTQAVDVQFAYRMESEAPPALDGTVALRVRIAHANGWDQIIDLGSPAPVRGAAGEATATLDISRLRALVDEVAQTTGVAGGAPRVEIVADVDVHGTVAGGPISEQFDPRLGFQLDGLQLRLAGENVGVETGPDPLNPVSAGSLRTGVTAPRRLSLLGRGLDVGDARLLAVGAAAVSALALLVAGAMKRDGRRGEASDIAAQYDCLILHETGSQADRYLFQVDQTVYRYVSRRSAAAASAAAGETESGGPRWPADWWASRTSPTFSRRRRAGKGLSSNSAPKTSSRPPRERAGSL